MRDWQRIRVEDGGVVVTFVRAERVSVFGNVIREGGSSEYTLPWDEIFSARLGAAPWSPEGETRAELIIDLTWGEFVEVHEDAEGFSEAVAELCRRSGMKVPNALDDAEIWPGPPE